MTKSNFSSGTREKQRPKRQLEIRLAVERPINIPETEYIPRVDNEWRGFSSETCNTPDCEPLVQVKEDLGEEAHLSVNIAP